MSEKTEQPTPQRVREARKKGQLARSRLLSSSVVTAGGLFGLLTFAPDSAARLRGWTAALFAQPFVSAEGALLEAASMLALLAAPALAGALLASAAVSVACAGLELQVGAVAPRFERIDPLAGLKRLVSARQLIDLGKGLLVAAILVAVVWGEVRDGAGPALRAVRLDGPAALVAVLRLLGPALGKCAALIVVFGAADYLLARRRHLEDLMMTKEEVKQEHKSAEGDPRHKAARKAQHRQLAMGGPARGVQKATCIVVNPTHIAVALRYDERECEAPYIVAKGREEDALKIRRAAKRQGIPVVKDVPLARSLVHFDVGEEIPEELYRAAAAVLKIALEKHESDSPDP